MSTVPQSPASLPPKKMTTPGLRDLHAFSTARTIPSRYMALTLIRRHREQKTVNDIRVI